MDNQETISKKPVYKKVWFWILIILAILMIIGIAEGDTTPTSSNGSNSEVQQTKEKFTLVDSNGSYDGFAYYVTGTIKNNTNKKYSYVQVTFNLYDTDGAQIGTALANINNLEENGTWKFKAIGTTEKAASYKLAEITGW